MFTKALIILLAFNSLHTIFLNNNTCNTKYPHNHHGHVHGHGHYGHGHGHYGQGHYGHGHIHHRVRHPLIVKLRGKRHYKKYSSNSSCSHDKKYKYKKSSSSCSTDYHKKKLIIVGSKK